MSRPGNRCNGCSTRARKPPNGDAPTTTLNPAFFDYRARIDHVFAERGRFDLLEARVVFDATGADGTWPSDHFGLYVRLRLRR